MALIWRASALLVCAGHVLSATRASADERPRVRLVVEHEPSLPACPDERTMRDAIAEKLGYDPVDAAARASIVVRFSSTNDEIVARVSQQEEPAASLLTRELHTGTRVCSEAARIVALTLALAVDPLAAPLAPAAFPSGPEPSDLPASHESLPAPTRESALAPAWTFAAGAGGAVLFGVLPQIAPAAMIVVGADARRFAFEVGVEGSLPGAARDPSGLGVRASLLGGSTSACVLLHGARLCPGLFVGVLRGESIGLAVRGGGATPLVTARLRAAFDLALGAGVVLRPFAEISTPLTPTTLGFGSVDVWTTPSLAGSLGLLGLFRP